MIRPQRNVLWQSKYSSPVHLRLWTRSQYSLWNFGLVTWREIRGSKRLYSTWTFIFKRPRSDRPKLGSRCQMIDRVSTISSKGSNRDRTHTLNVFYICRTIPNNIRMKILWTSRGEPHRNLPRVFIHLYLLKNVLSITISFLNPLKSVGFFVIKYSYSGYQGR